VPAAGNARDTVVFCVSPMSPAGGLGDPWNFTLWVGAGAKVQLTVPPAVIVTQLGEKVLLAVAFTPAVAEAPPACTVTGTPVELTAPPFAEAVIVDEPMPTPLAVFVAPLVLASATFDPSPLDQLIVVEITLPCALRASAAKFTVPHAWMVCAPDGWVMTTLATCGGGVGPPPPPSPPPPHATTAAAAKTRPGTRM